MPPLSESPVITRFFKVMVPGFHAKLCLPPAFCMKLKGEIPEKAFLTSCKGTWRVEIYQCSEGKFCFLDGWNKFVKNHDLKIGEFVVFEQISGMHFNATVFDSTTCAKQFIVEGHEERESSRSNTNEHVEVAKSKGSNGIGGRGRPQKRAAYVNQKVFLSEIDEGEATLVPNIDENPVEAKRRRGRPRKILASPKRTESSVEILEEKAPNGRNIFGGTIQKRGRGRPRKETESLQQNEKLLQRKTECYNMNYDVPSEEELSMKINEEHVVQMGRLSNGAASHWKQNHFIQKIMPYNLNHHSPGLTTLGS